MQPEEAEGLLVVRRPASAANEEFADAGSAARRHARPHSGWDAYEVWRTRVKLSPSPARAKRDFDPER
jgi:hypothetical protein